jgi:predicted phosphoadenosine phosphosulfate sulfurtransferase
MRVSNVHHETAVRSLYYMQEIEPDNWNRLVARISGINTAGQIKEDLFSVSELPYMFGDWIEYRDYLLENLIRTASRRTRSAKSSKITTRSMSTRLIREAYARVCITAMLKNDYHMTVIENFHYSPDILLYRRWRKGMKVRNPNKYVQEAMAA